jgi:hypothetical protein
LGPGDGGGQASRADRRHDHQVQGDQLGEPSGTPASPSTAYVWGGRSSLKTSERCPVSTCFIAGSRRCKSLSAITS